MFLRSEPHQKIVKLLKLEKPLVVFDIETTGLSLHSDKIVELAYIKIWPSGRVKKEDMLFDPEMAISPEAVAVHGIEDQHLKGKPKFRDAAHELWEVFQDSYYGGFNVMNFDLPLIRREFLRCGMDFFYTPKDIVDSREIFRKMVPRSLSSTYEYYTGHESKGWHTAMADTESSLEILVRQLEKYKEVRDWEFINKMHKSEEDENLDGTRKFYWLHGEAYFAFSKYRDRPVKEIARVDPGFMNWILKADFSEEVKNIIGKAMEQAVKQPSLLEKIKEKL